MSDRKDSSNYSREFRKHEPLLGGEFLNAPTAYGFLFQTEPYHIDRTFLPGVVRLIVDPFLPNKISNTDVALENLRPKSDIVSGNISTLVFKGDPRFYIPALDEYVLSKFHPLAAELVNSSQIDKLKEVLFENNDLNPSAEFAGVLFLQSQLTWDLFANKDLFRRSLAIGVVDKVTNNELGIIFCPQEMLEFRLVDPKSSKKRQKVEEVQMVEKPILVDSVI